MPISLNLFFCGTCPNDEVCDHPKGFHIAKLLEQQIGSNGWDTSSVDNWRDAGWSIVCEREEISLLVTFAVLEKETDWMLQISSNQLPYTPGMLGKLFGKKPKTASARPNDCYELAVFIHATLKNSEFSPERWCWDGFPDKNNSTKEPVLLASN